MYVEKHVDSIPLDSMNINSLCESVMKVNRKHCLLKICHLIFLFMKMRHTRSPIVNVQLALD